MSTESTESKTNGAAVERLLSAHDLLAGSQVVHEVEIPPTILHPGRPSSAAETAERTGIIRLRPLSIATLTLISRAAQDDSSLIPLLMLKESLVEPSLSMDQLRQMHVGLVEFLMHQVNLISGLEAQADNLQDAVHSPLGQTHILLAKHFGWTPEQVTQLTPGQVAVYLAGIERLLQLEDAAK